MSRKTITLSVTTRQVEDLMSLFKSGVTDGVPVTDSLSGREFVAAARKALRECQSPDDREGLAERVEGYRSFLDLYEQLSGQVAGGTARTGVRDSELKLDSRRGPNRSRRSAGAIK